MGSGGCFQPIPYSALVIYFAANTPFLLSSLLVTPILFENARTNDSLFASLIKEYFEPSETQLYHLVRILNSTW
jgi:hypothetical protein